MARFTTIPESDIAGTLGSILGRNAGTLGSKAMSTLTDLENQVKDICQNVLYESKSDYDNTVSEIETKLNAIEKSLSGIETGINTVNATAKATKIPIAGLKASILAIKVLPIPQVSQVVAFSMVEAEMLTILTETVAQAEQIIDTLEAVVKLIKDLLKKIRALIDRIRLYLLGLKASQAVDKCLADERLRSSLPKGIMTGTGQNIFLELTDTLSRKGTTKILWYGDLEGIDRYSVYVQNKIYITPSNTKVNIRLSKSGDSVYYAYYGPSFSRPKKLSVQDFDPKDWSLTEPLNGENYWYSKATVSGLTGKVYMWTEPEPYQNKLVKHPGMVSPKRDYEGESKDVLVLRLGIDRIDPKSFLETDTYAVIVTDENSAQSFMSTMLDNLGKVKEIEFSVGNITAAETLDKGQNMDSKVEYRAGNGELYTLSVLVDRNSPIIAQRRYVEVMDSRGTVVYTGTKSFTTDIEVLLEETKVRLDQLFS